jgi:hypothetical protein
MEKHHLEIINGSSTQSLQQHRLIRCWLLGSIIVSIHIQAFLLQFDHIPVVDDYFMRHAHPPPQFLELSEIRRQDGDNIALVFALAD